MTDDMRVSVSKKESTKLLKELANSPRITHIHKVQKLAMEHGRCKEALDGKCMYPHCQCLYGKNGPIDPITGKEFKSKVKMIEEWANTWPKIGEN